MSRRFHGLKLADWPLLDQRLWAASLTRAPFLEHGSIAATWSPSTIGLVVENYGYALDWQKERDDFDPTQSPTRRWTVDAIGEYVAELKRCLSPATVHIRFCSLLRALTAMEPHEDRTLLQRVTSRLPSMSDRSGKRARLQSTSALVDLGAELMQRAVRRSERPPLRRAILYRDGLQIALLALRPLRKKNFSMIQIGRHLISTSDGWQLRFAADEIKTRNAQHFGFPEMLAQPLETYLQVFRPILCGATYSGSHLWVSRYAKPLSPNAIQACLTLRTKAAFGKPINPHLFRDCAATSIAIDDPTHVRIAAAVLGHSNFATTQRHYNLAGTIDAARNYNDLIEQYRSSKRDRRGGSRS